MNEKEIYLVLKYINNKLKNKNVIYRLCGSANLKVQKVNVSVGDVDIETNKEGLEVFREVFKDKLVKDYFKEKTQAHILDLDIHNFEVEISFYEDKEKSMLENIEIIKFKDLNIPTLSLANAKKFYEMIGKQEKSELISKYLEKNMIKAIIFDMDGVLVDSMKHHIYSWKKAFDNEGLKSDEKELSLFEGMSFKETIKRISKHNNKEISIEAQRKIHEDKRKILSEVFKLEIYEEVVEILKFLKEKGLRLGVVTGSNREFATKIIEDNFKEMFEVVVTGDDTKFGKPHPQPYNKAKQKLGLKEEEILVVENAPLGIISAKKAGLEVIAIETTLEKKHLKQSDKVLKDHKELLAYFEELI